MPLIRITCLCIVSLALARCGGESLYEQQTRSLDSLSGAITQKIKELEKTDTVLLQRCITRYGYYRQFIKQNIHDTIGKAEADHLQRFITGGENLTAFRINRRSLMARAKLMQDQQKKLASDLSKHKVNATEAGRFVASEMKEGKKLTETIEAQQKLFYSGVEEFKHSIREVEALMRLRNHGELPTIVKDTLAL